MCKVQLKNARLRPFALFMALFLMNVSWAFAQLTVTGNVQSTTGEPLIGVNVIEKAPLMELLLTWTETTHSVWQKGRPLYSLTSAFYHKKLW